MAAEPRVEDRARRLRVVQREMEGCRACPDMIGPVIHGPPVVTPVFLLGQAPGPHEGRFGRPFAWTAGKTLFGWFERAVGVDEARFRERIYMAAVARCFPGKAKGGGDRKPSPAEIDRCETYLRREVKALAPELVIAVGAMAIERVLGHTGPLAEVVGASHRTRWYGVTVDVIPLPHPSGASTWHRTEPGKSLLDRAMKLVAAHPAIRRAFELEDG